MKKINDDRAPEPEFLDADFDFRSDRKCGFCNSESRASYLFVSRHTQSEQTPPSRRDSGLFLFIFVLAIILFVSGCFGTKEARRIESLQRDPSWPTIRAAAEAEISRREGNPQWSHSAYYAPKQHTNGFWVVVASGAYPLNTLGDSIELIVRDNGKVVAYSPRQPVHPG